jgi:glyoxylase-like metal-dependent hydrolase (beta-lactamase superfamily II)
MARADRVLLALILMPSLLAQAERPWCKALPRSAYKSLERVAVNETWFEAYRIAPGVFAIYEPHQSEETISYLITGERQALLFDTGMGIGDLRNVTAELTKLPVVVLNSHAHNDLVGANWQFDTVYGMDTEFTRASARGSREDASSRSSAGRNLRRATGRLRRGGLRDPAVEDRGVQA